MKKISLAVLILLVFSVHSAQALGLRLGAEANFVKPSATLVLDELSNTSFDQIGYGITAFAMADIILAKITANAGYLDFGEQSFEFHPIVFSSPTMIEAKAKVTAIPLLIGLRWEFGLPIGPKFHFGAQAGVHNFTFTYEGTAVDYGLLESSQTESRFSFAPVVGLRWSGIDASLFYMVVEDFNYAGLRIGYTFGIGL